MKPMMSLKNLTWKIRETLSEYCYNFIYEEDWQA
jgi:hypothetical protein